MAQGYGVLLNDDISDMERFPGHPNSIGPNKRSVANMAPTIVFKNGKPRARVGTPGSVRIFPALAQVIGNMLFQGMDLEKAVAAGRVHWEDNRVLLRGRHRRGDPREGEADARPAGDRAEESRTSSSAASTPWRSWRTARSWEWPIRAATAWPSRCELQVRLRDPRAAARDGRAWASSTTDCFFTYFDVARFDYLRNLGLLEQFRTGESLNLIVHTSADFRSPARFDDVILVHVRAARSAIRR
jgi:hypothetical protein